MERDNKMVKTAVLRSAGTNCNNETEHAFKMLGVAVEQIHVNEFISGSRNFYEFDIVAIPGGFSYGDYIAAGTILANQLSKLKQQLQEFVDAGKVLIGICNGFQVLVKAGLLPGEDMNATLTNNDSGNFECRWVKLIDMKGGEMRVPVAHAEGKFFTDEKTLQKLEENKQIVYKYSDSKFPANPNGSIGDIAGISNKKGNVIGLMPHPERHLTCENHPQWTRRECQAGEGLQFFKMVIDKAGGER